MSARSSQSCSHRESWWSGRSWWWTGIVVIMPYIVVFVFGYESWVGRLIAGAYIWAVAFVIICIFVVFAPSERLITPAGKLRHMKSDTPRRVVEVIARTLGARYSNLCHRISHQIWIGYLGDSIQAWSGDDLRQAHRPELYREELGAL